jgi:hypothetical protein
MSTLADELERLYDRMRTGRDSSRVHVTVSGDLEILLTRMQRTAPVLIAALRLADARVLAVNARILFDHGPADEHAMERWARAHKAADAELAAFAAYCALLDGLPKTEGT